MHFCRKITVYLDIYCYKGYNINEYTEKRRSIVKKNQKTRLMAAAFAAAMSLASCTNNDDEFTTVYGPPPDTDTTAEFTEAETEPEKAAEASEEMTDVPEAETEAVTEAAQQPETEYEPATEDVQFLYGPPDVIADEDGTEPSTEPFTGAAEDIPPVTKDPNGGRMQVVYGPPPDLA